MRSPTRQALISELGNEKGVAVMDRRRQELAERLAAVQDRIAAACDRAGRERHDVSLVVVTKFFPASDVALLYELGAREFGESRDQEARAKVAELCAAPMADGPGSLPGVRWHMIGRVQSNKAKSVASWAQVVQSVDSAKLVSAFANAAGSPGQAPLDILLQVSLDGDTSRGGALPEDIPSLSAQVAQVQNLRLTGLMSIPPLNADPAVAYAKLARLHAALRVEHPQAAVLSAGMSGDFEIAIAAGSSCVRVGAAILGQRSIPSP